MFPRMFCASLALLVSAALAGCASDGTTDRAPDRAKYVFVWLKTGPESATKTAEERKPIFEGHMANIKRLTDEGKLVIAGPFDKPRDPAWRGIFVMNVPTEKEARALVATDPGVISGVFVMDLRPMVAPSSLRDVPRLDKELNAENKEPPKPGEPPRNMRKFVLVTATDVARVDTALAGAALEDRVIWRGTFTGASPGGVLVLDSTDAEDIRARLAPHDPGEHTCDGWWSTTAIERIPTDHAHRFTPRTALIRTRSFHGETP